MEWFFVLIQEYTNLGYTNLGSGREKARTQCDSSPTPPPPFYNLTNAPEWSWSKLQNQPALYSFPNIYTVWISNHEHHDLQCKHGNQRQVKFSGQVTVRNFQEKVALSARVRSISKSMQYCHMTRAAPCAVSLWNGYWKKIHTMYGGRCDFRAGKVRKRRTEERERERTVFIW